MIKPGKEQVFSISNAEQFDTTALQVFKYQAGHCKIYRDFIKGLKIDPVQVSNIAEIPFLPISFFKNHAVKSDTTQAETIFTSSGTTGMITSQHFVTDVSWYEASFRKAFELFYGDIKKYTVLALLPSYLEREGSSLIYMAADLIKQ